MIVILQVVAKGDNILDRCWFVFGLFFLGFLFRYHPVVDSGLRNGPRSTFDSQCGMLTHALSNSFISTYIV